MNIKINYKKIEHERLKKTASVNYSSDSTAHTEALPPPRLIGGGALMRLLYPVRFYLLSCALLSAVGAAAGLAPYIAIAEISRLVIARPIIDTSINEIWFLVFIGCSGASLRLFSVFISSRIGHYADARTLHEIRTKLVAHLGILPLGWFLFTGSGAIKKAMINDLEEMHQLIAHALGEVIGATIAIVVGFGYLLYVDPRMACISISVIVLMAICFQIAMRSISIHMSRLTIAEGKISAASVEYADGITVVKTYNTGGILLDRFAAAVDEHTKAMLAWVLETRYSSTLSRLLGSEMTILGVVMVTGLFFVYNDSLSMANLLPFFIVGIGLPTSIVPAIHGTQGIRKGRVSASNIENILNKKPIHQAEDKTTPEEYQIEFDKVSFSYDGVNNAITELSFICEPGTITALVGPSGAGKSTIANLLPRFYDVDKGAIRIGGIDVRSMSSKTLLSSMSLVFQSIALLRDSILENIRIGRPDASLEEVVNAAKAAQIHDVIEGLPEGYNTLIDGSGGRLSGGEKQRLTIARAILSKAPIVILDEATASLDPDSETAVQNALAELIIGKAVLVIAHRLHTIASANQILVLKDGQLVEKGTHMNLLNASGLYSRMWNAQTEGVKS
ncbi:ABC transporter ATP-binding protein [Pedobacter sp. ISL-68]|uniref:ABC transporter ATP-binding protein n=1 Tax=unclassified Pedobacter TaxID=2628915 RepID=UPI001BE56F02|nr:MULTISPECIES: ABC transporter ATP-binding protein [unclassified Pedobacter]MBT2564682.1 ABC transporter ATP-binding protein [Pedobacter sp. ISL-64]MBT2592429.1 ABC transporter ATP-binding protein [Pedobacter sp. ISL-68]